MARSPKRPTASRKSKPSATSQERKVPHTRPEPAGTAKKARKVRKVFDVPRLVFKLKTHTQPGLKAHKADSGPDARRSSKKRSEIDQREIGLLAYQLWERAGRPGGRDQEFWSEAERQMRAVTGTTPADARLKADVKTGCSAAMPEAESLEAFHDGYQTLVEAPLTRIESRWRQIADSVSRIEKKLERTLA